MKTVLNFIHVCLLTTLFVSAMSLPATYATADGADKLPAQQDQQACSTVRFADFFTDEAKAEVKEKGGTFHVLTAQSDIERFTKRLELRARTPRPFTPDIIVISIPTAGYPQANVFFFKGDCLASQGHVPTMGVPWLLQDGDPEDETDERNKL